MSRFLGVWYEAERYFQLSEVVSRCVMANYTQGPDGKLRVSNEVTNRFTGIKRILEGEIKKPASRSEEGKLNVKYTTFPLTPETNYAVLETDYKNYAVLWSCQGIGPIHAQNAWLMTRSRRPAGEVLQMAYGVLDKYKISKTFFVKTDQADCAYLDTLAETDKPDYSDQQQIPIEEAPSNNLRSAINPDASDIIMQSKKSEIDDKQEELIKPVENLKENQEIVKKIPIEKETIEPVKIEEQQKPIVTGAVVTVPEAILKAADTEKNQSTYTDSSLDKKNNEKLPTAPLIPELNIKSNTPLISQKTPVEISSDLVLEKKHSNDKLESTH